MAVHLKSKRPRIATAVTTVTDTVVALESDLRDLLFIATGSGINCDFQTQDARYNYTVGTIIGVQNASSEFVGLRLSGQPAYVCRIPPRGYAEIVCSDVSTQAGTWSGGLNDDGLRSGNHVLDGSFATYANSAQTNDGGYLYANGAGATSRCCYGGHAATVAAMGFTNSWWYGYIGTAAAGYTYVRWGCEGSVLNNGFLMDAGPYSYEGSFSVDVLPTAAEDWIVGMGFCGTAAGDCAQLLLDRTMANPGNYYLDAAVGGVHTYTDTTIAAAAQTPTWMRVEKARGADRVDLWINKVRVANSAGGPIGTGYCSAGTYAIGVATAGGTTRRMSAGYQRFIQAPATPVL